MGDWLGFDVVFGVRFHEVRHVQAGRFRTVTGLLLVPGVKNPRQQNCAGVGSNGQKQIVRMIRHLLKAIGFVEIDCSRLRIHHKTNTANFTGNTSYAVYGIE